MAFGNKPRRVSEPLDAAGLFNYALGSLARQPRTVEQIKRLMQKRVEKGEDGEVKIEAVILKLKDLGYLDDPAFAADYTRLRQENEKFGRRRVQQDLMIKGVDPELISSTLDTAYENVGEEDLARRHIARKRLKKPTNEKETARVMRRLVRAGFSIGVIVKVLRNWQVDEDTLQNFEAQGVDDDSGPED